MYFYKAILNDKRSVFFEHKKYISRDQLVLRLMVDDGVLSPAEIEDVISIDLVDEQEFEDSHWED